jgi:hypothetical protein
MTTDNNISNPAFKGIYKVTMPDIRTINNEKEKEGMAETMINTIVLGTNFSIAEPRVAKDNSAVYFKIDNKNDKIFESNFKKLIDECNKQFNMDVAKKVYYNKTDDKEFNKAIELK